MNPESTLNQLKSSLGDGQLPSSYGVYFKNTLVALCHALEDHILQNSDATPDQQPLVLVTFQEGKWYLQEAERYFDMVQSCRHVVISAVADSGFLTHRTGQLENVSLINLDPSDSLVMEWNLIILAPSYTTMVLCHELMLEEYPAHSQPTIDTERKFYGLWTFDQKLVQKAAEILIERFRPYNPELADNLLAQHQQIVATPYHQIPDLTSVVSRIVSYLQSSQQELITVNRQTRELWELEGQAKRVSRNISGNDIIQGNLGADYINSGDGNDSVYGGQGNDTLLGGGGNDYLAGDKGINQLTGGFGIDNFSVRAFPPENTGSSSNFIPTNADIITDFTPGEDLIIVSGVPSFAQLRLTSIPPEAVRGVFPSIERTLGGGTLIEVQGTGQIIGFLENIQPQQLLTSSFLFFPTP